MNFAGAPPHNSFGGMLLVTTLPAATIAPSPIVTPFSIMQPTPIKQFEHSVTLAFFLLAISSSGFSLSLALREWKSVS